MSENYDYLINGITTIVMISGAAERLVEMIKGMVPQLNAKLGNPVLEARRKAWIQVITLIVCVGTAVLTQELIVTALGLGAKDAESRWWICVGIGVLSVGGSSFWNSILSYLVGAKDLKKAEANEQATAVEQTRTAQVALRAPPSTRSFGSHPIRI